MAFVRSPDQISIELLQDGEALPLKEPWVSIIVPERGDFNVSGTVNPHHCAIEQWFPFAGRNRLRSCPVDQSYQFLHGDPHSGVELDEEFCPVGC